MILTVGRNQDPADFGPQPSNVRIERYIPQSLLFPHCDVVVCHGGSGTVLAALSWGLPLLVLPQGANQFWNAERCAALGTGIRLLPGEVSPASVRRAVVALLKEPRFRYRAGELAAEIQHMPSPSELVATLQALVAGPEP